MDAGGFSFAFAGQEYLSRLAMNVHSLGGLEADVEGITCDLLDHFDKGRELDLKIRRTRDL